MDRIAAFLVVAVGIGGACTTAESAGPLNWKLSSEFVDGKVVAADGGEIAFARKPGSGPTLLLLPETFADRRIYAPLLRRLDASLQIVVIEHRGLGGSWPPMAKPSIEACADDAVQVANKLGVQRFFVGGHSLGGMIALEIGRHYPERVCGIVSIEGWTNANVAREAFQGNMLLTLPAIRIAELAEYRSKVLRRWTPAQKTAFGGIWRQWDGASFLQKTTLPILEIYGDRGKPRPARSLLGLPDRPNVELHWMSGASHSLPVERPETLATAVNAFVRAVDDKHALPIDRRAYDVVVVGGTPGGIAAAVAAARCGQIVLLIEPQRRLGGMATGGLGKCDIENRSAIGGVFREFTKKTLAHYLHEYGPTHANVRLCHDGYYFEPSVAEHAFEAMLGNEPKMTVLRGWQMSAARKSGRRLIEVSFCKDVGDGSVSISARVFVDATYEGDLLAAAGAGFRIGRESRNEFGEPHAGVVYFDYQTGKFLSGTTGAGDDRLPAYTYRLCLTDNPNNARPLTEAPTGYDRRNYLGYFDDWRAGRLAAPRSYKPGRGYNPEHFDTLVRALSVTPLPNGKTDVNINPRPLGFPFAEENRGYIEADEPSRERIRERHRQLTLGLLWFLQNDPEVPEPHRKLARKLQLPMDEFTNNGGFPHQLYVREARRLRGLYTLTENDVTAGRNGRPMRHADAVAVGEFPIDSFPCRKRQPTDTVVLEGYLGMLDSDVRPYELPYRIMIPETVDALIVPVAASTTHVAFSSIRTEPTWMALGQAAGTAADLAIRSGVELRNVSISELQRQLVERGQVVRFP